MRRIALRHSLSSRHPREGGDPESHRVSLVTLDPRLRGDDGLGA